MRLEIQLLGGFAVRRDGREVRSRLPTAKAVSLFTFLLLPPGRALSREHLAEMLWPGPDPEPVAPRLNGALYYIRNFLRALGEGAEAALVARKKTVHLNPPADWSVDVWVLEEQLQAVDAAPVDAPEGRRAREAAVRLYRGPLLPELKEEEWCRDRRFSLEQRVLECLHELTRANRERGRLAAASGWAQRALELDDCDEISHRELMQIEAWMGDVEAALGQYEACKRALLEKLGSPPDPETLRLYQWLEHLARGVGRGARGRVRARPPAEAVAGPEPRAGDPVRGGGLPSDATAPLVGRERELERLRGAWERAREGEGSTILLTGDAGIGKSRLAREFLQEVEQTGGLTLSGQAYALERGLLYQPLRNSLRQAQGMIEEQGLDPCPPVWMAQVARLLPELQPEGVSAADDSARLVEGLSHFYLHLARQRPLCFFLDDLQNVDPATGAFLRFLCGQVERAGLLLLGAHREGEVAEAPWLAEWMAPTPEARSLSVLRLLPLDEQQVTDLLQWISASAVAPGSLELLGRRLYEETEGHPLVFWEIVRQWFEEGYLSFGEEGAWELRAEWLREPPRRGGRGATAADGRPRPVRPAPEVVAAVVRQRVSRLPEAERRLLECAAVIGRRFDFETLARATGYDPRVTLAGLEHLLAAALVDALPETRAYDFRHDKYREVIYGDLLPAQRREWHRRVGTALEAIYDLAGVRPFEESGHPMWLRRRAASPDRARAEEHAAELAWHFAAASQVEPERVAGYCFLAGVRARALSAYPRAVEDLMAAHALLASLPVDEQRLAQLGQVVEQLGPAYAGAGRAEEARQAYAEQIARCERHGYVRGLVRACVSLGQFLELHLPPPGFVTSQDLYERAIDISSTHILDDLIAYPQYLLAFLLAHSDRDLERAEALVQAGLERAGERRDDFVLRRHWAVRIWLAAKRADWATVREAFQRSLACGGPEEYTFALAVDTIEERCLRGKVEATYRKMCEEFAAGYARAALTAPVQQWNLAPLSPRPVPGEPTLREAFDGEPWHPALIWRDPTNQSQVDRVARPGWLGLRPAVGANLWPENNLNAPRLMVRALAHPGPGAGYAAQTRVALGSAGDIFAGLLIWQDEQNFARLELRATPWDWTAVHLQACIEGVFRQIGRGHCERGAIWLRVERDEEELHALCSADGKAWFGCGSVRFPLAETEEVGIAAIADNPDRWAWFESFTLWREE